MCDISKARKDRLVEEALELLPEGLPNTYTRILERIEAQSPYMKELALNCLAWMIYARRPLSTQELRTALAIRANYSSIQDLELDESVVILEACGNLLEEARGVIRPIHYTVQEFLSKPEPRSKLPKDCFQRQLSIPSEMHIRLGQACLHYIHLVAFTQPVNNALELYRRLRRKPFISYASHNFDYHFAEYDSIPLDAKELLDTFLQLKSEYLAAILQIRVLRDEFNDYDTVEQQFDAMRFPVSAGTVVYSSNLYDIPKIRERWVDDAPPAYVLHRACSAGLATAVERLLDAGCNVKERDGSGGTPLYFASLEGHCQIIYTLLNRGADIDLQGGYHGNALQAASSRGHEAVVKLLLDKGADPNKQGGEYGHALQAASRGGHEAVVKILLGAGADINAQGGEYGNALQAASTRGHEAVVKVLLDKGADINAQGGRYGNALRAAQEGKHWDVMKTLLGKGANPNEQGGRYGNALQAASSRGHEAVVKMLLNAGANVNALGGLYGNALQAASSRGHEAVVKMLLDASANVNAQGRLYGNALQAASEGGHEAVVKMLLDKGADITT